MSARKVAAARLIRFVDLPRQFERYRDELLEAVSGVLERGDFILGEAVKEFEGDFARYVGARFAVGTSSGTSALALALRAAGVGPGDEVITAPNSFIASALAATQCGATPVFADIDERTQLLDPERVAKALSPRTKALLPVHLFGQMAPMAPLLELARKREIAVIEDACQAHGAEQHQARAGTLGRAAAWSFYPGKNLGAAGDAGAVTTDDERLAEQVRTLRNVGSAVKYRHALKGDNARLDTLQAAVLRVKLRHLDEWNARRREIAGLYSELLAGVGDITLPWVAVGNKPVWHLYVVRSPGRDALARHLAAREIPVVIHYPVPIHLQPAYAELGHRPGSFPVAERLAREVLSLPIHPELSDDDVVRVTDAVRSFFK